MVASYLAQTSPGRGDDAALAANYIAFGFSILVVLALFVWMYRGAKRRRGVRFGCGLSAMALGFILSEQIFRLNPERNLPVSTAVALVMTFIGGLAIGTAVFPKPPIAERDI